MDDTVRRITAEDINPRFNWGRALPALGIMGVDFEERVDYRRLHRYRLSRVKMALDKSELGALLVFDVNNIRYITSTKIGEWERDKLSRWALLTRTGEPILWDFGSAAVHHKLYTPWLAPENCNAGLVGLRGTVDPAFGLMKRHAEEIASILREAGVADMPIGVDIIEPPMLFELEKAGLKVQRRPAGDARSARDQMRRRDRAAQPRRRDGRRRLSPDPRAAQARRARERHRRRGQQVPLHPRLRRRRSDQRDLRRALQSASAQLHRPHDPAGRPGVLRHPAVLHGLPHLLLPHLQCRPRHAGAARRLQEGARVARQRHGADQAGRGDRPTSAAQFPTCDKFGFPDEMSAFGLQFAHGLGLALHERPIISRVVSMDHPTEIKEGMVFAIETYCPATDGYSAARIEEEVVVTDKGCRVITLFPAEELPIASEVLIAYRRVAC